MYNVFEYFDKVSAREVYGQKLIELGEKHQNIVVLSADLVRSTNITKFHNRYPERTFDVGIAEQNLFGISAGLALEGKIPFASTFSAFASMRACEQLRTDICYPNLNVRIIATHAGLSMGAGATHAAQEDIAITRSMPNLTVIAPGDPLQVAKILDASMDHKGPIYIRMGRGGEPVVYHDDYDYQIGKAIITKDGKDITFAACGDMVAVALTAAQELDTEGVSVRVLDLHTIRPIDRDAIIKASKETGKIIACENHNVTGGLGSAIADVIADENLDCRFKRVGIPDVYISIGDPESLMRKYGMDKDGVIKAAKELL